MAHDPHEALGYYATAAAMIEKELLNSSGGLKGKERQQDGVEEDSQSIDEAKTMAVTALVAMIEIWMSDLW